MKGNNIPDKTVDEYCGGCLHLHQMDSGARRKYCDYIGYHGHSRGCPPGKGCVQKWTATEKEAEEWRRKIITLGGLT